MNNNLAFNLNTAGLIIFAVIAIVIMILMFNNKLTIYLKHHFIIGCLFNSSLWLSLWLIGNEFIKWWLSGVIALLVSVFIEEIANYVHKK